MQTIASIGELNAALLEDNAATQVLTVSPNLNATLTGSGPTGFAVPANTPFGCTDFRAYNIDFRNLNEGSFVLMRARSGTSFSVRVYLSRVAMMA